MPKSYWKNHTFWLCPNHIPHALHHKISPRCTYSNCSTEMPELKKPEGVLVFKLESKEDSRCAWEKCCRGPFGTHATKRKKSKYCSVQCKNDNARYRFKKRNALKRIA